jgi:hypothetical protein
LHWSSSEKGAVEFLVLEPLRHPIDHVHGALIGRSGAPQVGLRLVQPTFKGYWRRIMIFRFEIVLKAA